MANVNTILKQESGRIGSDITRRMLHTSPWFTLVKKDTWPDGMGYQVSRLTYNRSLPKVGAAEGLTWVDLAQNSGAEIADPNASKATITFTTELTTYKLQRAVVESPDINVEDLRFSAYRKDQLSAIVDILAENTRYAWENRYRDLYLDQAKYAVLIDASIDWTAAGGAADPFAGVVTNAAAAACVALTQSHLNAVYPRLVLAGAGMNALGRESGRPVFGLITSGDASRRVLEDTNIRTDFRESPRVSELLTPLGVDRSFNGFFHLIDDMPPRYQDGGTHIERVMPFVEDANPANGFIVNDDYLTAPYEVAFIFHQDVYTSLVPKPITSGPGVSFDPMNYAGAFDWKNIPDRTLNPDGTIGFFRGTLANGAKSIRPEYGYAMLFKRNQY